MPGEIKTPFPTINNLAIEWELEGDDDLEASCEVRYKAASASEWRMGMPLRRVPGGSSQKTTPIVSWTNRLSGSLFDLEPDTEYAIELSLTDPDGGSARRTVTARTRPEPRAAPEAPVRNGGLSDLNSAKPGEIMLLTDGDYGAVRFNRDGLPGRPIVYRSESGKAVFSEIGLTDRKWVYLEGLTVNGPIRMNGTDSCVVRRCSIRSQYGIKAYQPGMTNGCIEDNVITGVRTWDVKIMGAGGDNEGEGIEITGSGNVIRFNRVSGFRDCLSHMEDAGAVKQMCNDWHNNDVGEGLDDGIEGDFAASNCRFYRNRITNCFVGISSQPGLGGPNYFIRNTMYNLSHSAFKLHRYSIGDVILHNTVVKAGDGFGIYTSEPFDHALVLNNLFVGGKAANEKYGGYSPGRGRAVDVQKFGDHCRFDFNAFVVHQLPFEGKYRSWTFTKLPGTEFEPHGLQSAYDDLEAVPFPFDPSVRYPAVSLKLKSVAAAVDAADRIDGINDSFIGKGPDIGALEYGVPDPVYGPR